MKIFYPIFINCYNNLSMAYPVVMYVISIIRLIYFRVHTHYDQNFGCLIVCFIAMIHIKGRLSVNDFQFRFIYRIQI